jgi:hypothetical protein
MDDKSGIQLFNLFWLKPISFYIKCLQINLEAYQNLEAHQNLETNLDLEAYQ